MRKVASVTADSIFCRPIITKSQRGQGANKEKVHYNLPDKDDMERQRPEHPCEPPPRTVRSLVASIESDVERQRGQRERELERGRAKEGKGGPQTAKAKGKARTITRTTTMSPQCQAKSFAVAVEKKGHFKSECRHKHQQCNNCLKTGHLMVMCHAAPKWEDSNQQCSSSSRSSNNSPRRMS